jgi:hypothetical protein
MRQWAGLVLVVAAGCVLQTETVSGPEGKRGPKGDPQVGGNAETIDGLDASAFMRADRDTGTVGGVFVGGPVTVGATTKLRVTNGGTFMTGESPELDSSTLTVRSENPTFGGGAAIVNIDTSSDANPSYFLRSRKLETSPDGGPPTATDRFLVSHDLP